MCRLLVVAACLTLSIRLGAQAPSQPAVLRGFVLADSTEVPLAGAEVAIASLGVTGRAAADGAFRLGGIAPGTYMLTVRALGYEPLTNRVRFAPGDSLERDYLLVRAAVPIAGVSVTGTGESVHNPKLATFEARMRTATGNFLTRATLDSMSDRRLGEILASRLAGARVVNGNASAWVATRRGQQSIQRRPAMSRFDRARGADPTACYAAVYLDGTLVYGGAEGESLFDVNTLGPSEVAGIEFYAGGSQLPVEINRPAPTCGALVIWTR